MTLGEMRARMTTAEFAEWVAFYNWEAAQHAAAKEKAGKGRGRR